MATFLLIIIYLAFISLGLPDSAVGVSWPKIYPEFGVPITNAGIVFAIISCGTIISSFLSSALIKRFGTHKICAASAAMTAGALFCFSAAPSFIWLCLIAVPLGLGGGAIDAALNNFVALHYKAIHMNWLHCFWGIGAATGPVIMSFYIALNNGWRKGVLIIACMQTILVLILLFSAALWKKAPAPAQPGGTAENNSSPPGPLNLPKVKTALASFFFYCAAEATMGLWTASYLVNHKLLTAADAAIGVSLFYWGITIGRAFSGFLTLALKNYMLIRLGQILCISGAAVLLLPLPVYANFAGILLIGLGCAPIYPAMLHETPNRFGEKASQSVMGIQMGFAYTGTTLMPAFFGIFAAKHIAFMPLVIVLYAAAMLLFSENINLWLKKQNRLA